MQFPQLIFRDKIKTVAVVFIDKKIAQVKKSIKGK